MRRDRRTVTHWAAGNRVRLLVSWGASLQDVSVLGGKAGLLIVTHLPRTEDPGSAAARRGRGAPPSRWGRQTVPEPVVEGRPGPGRGAELPEEIPCWFLSQS